MNFPAIDTETRSGAPRAVSASFLRRGFDPTAENFCDAPRLGDAAARSERGFCIENLADRTDAGFIQVGHETLEQRVGAGTIVGIDFQPGVDERSDQPRP